MPRRARVALVVSFTLCMSAGGARPGWARSEKTLAYARDQVWSTAVRFLAVDEHARITEKDAEAGYVTFELRDEGKPYRGSLEVVTVQRDGQTAVRFVVQIADRPSWMELAMLARLEDKLRAELGSPTPPRKAEPGKDKDGKEGKDKDGKDGKDGKDDGSGGKDSDRHDDGPPVSPTP